jgi:HK97 family phage major capsid protein
VYENPAMATVGSASKSVAFGDFSRYIVRRVSPMRIEISRDAYYATDEVGIKTVERVDADLVDLAAVKVLVSAAT